MWKIPKSPDYRSFISYERENNRINDITKVDILTTEKLKKKK